MWTHHPSSWRYRRWLTPVSQRVVFKTALMVWKCVYGVAPAYLSDLCVPAAISGRQHVRSAPTGTLLVPRARTGTATGQWSFAVRLTYLLTYSLIYLLTYNVLSRNTVLLTRVTILVGDSILQIWKLKLIRSCTHYFLRLFRSEDRQTE